MRARFVSWGLIFAGIVLSMLATYAVAGLALHRPDVLRIDGAGASQLVADYSSDEGLPSRPPLSPGVIDAAAGDAAALDPGANPPPAPTPVPSVTPAPIPSTTTPVPVPPDSPQPRPTATREPEPTRTPEPRATATNTPLPQTPTVTPRPTRTPGPTRTLVPVCLTPRISLGDVSAQGLFDDPPKHLCSTPTTTPTRTATPAPQATNTPS